MRFLLRVQHCQRSLLFDDIFFRTLLLQILLIQLHFQPLRSFHFLDLSVYLASIATLKWSLILVPEFTQQKRIVHNLSMVSSDKLLECWVLISIALAISLAFRIAQRLGLFVIGIGLPLPIRRMETNWKYVQLRSRWFRIFCLIVGNCLTNYSSNSGIRNWLSPRILIGIEARRCWVFGPGRQFGKSALPAAGFRIHRSASIFIVDYSQSLLTIITRERLIANRLKMLWIIPSTLFLKLFH